MHIVALFIYSCTAYIVKSKNHNRKYNSQMTSKSSSVGIEKTLGDYIPKIKNKRVEGYIKLLPEDFQVQEIDTRGKIVKMEELAPSNQIKKALEMKKYTNSGKKFIEEYKKGNKINYEEKLLTTQDRERMENLIASLVEKWDSEQASEEKPFTLLKCEQAEESKRSRTKVHEWIRREMPFLESKTVTVKACTEEERMKEALGSHPDLASLPKEYNLIHVEPTSECLKALSSKNKKDEKVELEGETLEQIIKKMDKTDYKKYNPKSMSRYLHFDMVKINRETTEVINMMCRCLKRASFDFFSAGNKDKKGITTQRMCIRRCKIEDLLKGTTQGWNREVYVSNFRYKNKKIALGDLQGNHFKIAIRGIEEIEKAKNLIEVLKTNGFINYFGLQRFGTKIVGTHMMGAAIVDQRYDLAVRMIMGDIEVAKQYHIFNKNFKNITEEKLAQNCDKDDYKVVPNWANQENGTENEEKIPKYKRAIDHYLLENDPEKAIKYLPGHLYVEKSILKGILEKQSFEKCLERVPKNILSIYVHSTQSLLFNMAATERLNKYGYKVEVGDLVVRKEEEYDQAEEDGESDEHTDEKEEDDKRIEESEVEERGKKRKKRMQVVEITTEEEARRYRIEEVVLPLPGDNVMYPKNMREYYDRISRENFHIPLESFSTYKNVQGKREKCLVNISGSYRFLIVKPRDVKYEIVEKMEDPLKELIDPEIKEYEEEIEKTRNDEKIQKIKEEIKNKSALILKCSLPKSSYITVALREILTDESIEKVNR